MKNGILTVLFAFVPGAGQMYQGYMKRGLSLITMFCVGLLAGYLLEPLVAACLIVWMYSFFDTLNLRAAIGAGTAPEYDYLVHLDRCDPKMKRAMGESHKLLGWGLIALGAVCFYQMLMSTVGDVVYRWGQSSVAFRVLYLVLVSLPKIALGTALIVCGVWLVRGPRGTKRPVAENDSSNLLSEFTEYKAAEPKQPEPDAQPAAEPPASEAYAPADAPAEAPAPASPSYDEPASPAEAAPETQEPQADDTTDDFEMEVFIGDSGENSEG